MKSLFRSCIDTKFENNCLKRDVRSKKDLYRHRLILLISSPSVTITGVKTVSQSCIISVSCCIVSVSCCIISKSCCIISESCCVISESCCIISESRRTVSESCCSITESSRTVTWPTVSEGTVSQTSRIIETMRRIQGRVIAMGIGRCRDTMI